MASAARLRVSEIFESLQGEGPRAGTPSVFLRLADCNLRCRWCDTAYTWDWDRYDRDAEVTELSVAAVAERLAALGPANLVVTGGEPLLQQPALAALLERVRRARPLAVEVETAGTLVPEASLRRAVDAWNVSPKLATSGNPEAARRRPEALRAFAELPNASFKLVTAGEEDWGEIAALVAELGVPRSRVWLMPEAATRAELARRSPAVARLCRQHGVRFGPRVHVALFDGRRGL